MRSNCAEMRSTGASESAAHDRGQKHRDQHGDEGQKNGGAQRRSDLNSQKTGMQGDANFAERHLTSWRAEFKRIGNVIGLRRAIDQSKLLDEAGADKLAEGRTRKHLATRKRGVARNQGGSVAVDDGYFIDQKRVAHFGIDQ